MGQFQEKTILEMAEAIKLCKEAGREPVAFLINPKLADKLTKELKEHQQASAIIGLNKIFELTVFEHSKIKDFYLVDDRSWAEQKF